MPTIVHDYSPVSPSPYCLKKITPGGSKDVTDGMSGGPRKKKRKKTVREYIDQNGKKQQGIVAYTTIDHDVLLNEVKGVAKVAQEFPKIKFGHKKGVRRVLSPSPSPSPSLPLHLSPSPLPICTHTPHRLFTRLKGVNLP